MTWSTRELADLADTTVNTVRHYHALGVLDAPERDFNGYKQYRVPHLVRLIQVRRLVELGVPLAQVGAPGDDVVVPNGLQRVDAEAEAEIERLGRARSDIAAILRTSAPVDTPHGFESVAAQLSIADRSLIHVYARLHDETSVAELKEMVIREPASVRQGLDALRSDASEPARQRLADLIAQHNVNWRSVERPWLVDLALRRPRLRPRNHTQTITSVLFELYNAAQCDVISRATLLSGWAPRDGALELSA